MSSSYTYTTLKAAVTDMIEDQGADFAAFFDTALALAEDRILKDLDLELFEVVTATAFTAANPAVTKPTGAIATRTLHYTDANGNFVLIEPRSWEFVKDFWPKESTTTAMPKYYAEYSPTQWYIAGTPSGTNVVTSRCTIRPAGLTAINTTTWLSQYQGDLMFYACLLMMEQWTKADPRLGMWEANYTSRLASAKRELRQEDRVDYTPMTVNTEKEGN